MFRRKSVIVVFMVFVFFITTSLGNSVIFPGSISNAAEIQTNPVNYYGEMVVKGNRINGSKTENPMQVKGMSFFWSNWSGQFWNAATVDRMVDEFQCEIVRAAYGINDSGSPYEYGDENKVREVVNEAIKKGIYVIIDWHAHEAHQNPGAAKDFFGKMAKEFGSYDNVIFELYNEPRQVSWGTVKGYAEQVIPVIRQYSNNLIVVGTPTWSQDVDQAANDPIRADNIAYALHFYAGSHFQYLRDKGNTAMSKGLALFVTEWGSVNADGNGGINYGSTNEWMAWMDQNKISSCNWAINDKAETSSIFNTNGSLTEAGNFLKGLFADQAKNAEWRNGQVVTTHEIPGKIEAEDYALMSGVKKETCTEGGSNVGYIEDKDWMSYNVDVKSAGEYKVEYRVASKTGGGVISLEQNAGAKVLGTVNVPATGDWQTFTTISHTVKLEAGKQSIAIGVPAGGYNLNWINFTQTTATPTITPTITPTPTTSSATQPGNNPVSYFGEMVAKGNRINGSKTGTPMQVEGASFFWSNWSAPFWNAATVDRMADEFQCEIIRAAYGIDDDGTPYDSNDENKVREVVNEAIKKGIYVIIDWHAHNAYQNTGAAKDFFARMSKEYGSYDNVIFEIFNEPLQIPWATVKGYAEQVIPVIRQNSDNLIIVGTPTWSQDVDQAAMDPVRADNIAYAYHFYIGTHGQALVDKLNTALNKGAAIFASEWGFWDTNTDPMTVDQWLGTMDQNKISWCNWAINDKAEPASIFKTDGSLTDKGQYLKNRLAEHAKNAEWRKQTTVLNIPGKIEAEDYANMSGIKTETCTEGGSDVGYMDAKDWISYNVDVKTAGTYKVEYRVASKDGGGVISLEQNEGKKILGTVNVPSTGDWQNWTTVSHTVTLEAGKQSVAIGVPAGGYNLNWINFVPTTQPTSTPTPTATLNPIPTNTGGYDFKVDTTFSPTKLVANQMMTAKVVATNVSTVSYEGKYDVLLIVALYDSNNTMVNVSYISKGIPYHGTETLSAGFKLPTNITGYSVKAFMWDGQDLQNTNMLPLSNVTQIP